MAKERWDERPVERDDETAQARFTVSRAARNGTAGGVAIWDLPDYNYLDFGEVVEGQGEEDYVLDNRRRPGWSEGVVKLTVRLSSGLRRAELRDESLLDGDDIEQIASHYLATASAETCDGSQYVVATRIGDRIRDALERQETESGRLPPADVRGHRAGEPKRTAEDALRYALGQGGHEVLSDVENRRLRLLLDGYTSVEIARGEGVSKQSVNESINCAVRRLAEAGLVSPTG